MLNLGAARFLERFTVGRIGHAAKEVQLRLFAIVERTAKLERRMFLGKAETLLKMLESAPAADAERGAREDDGRDALEQQLAQDRTDVDRGTGESELVLPRGRAVEPIHLVGQLSLQPAPQRRGERLATIGGGFELDLLFLFLYALADAVNGAGQLHQVFRQRIRHNLGLANPQRLLERRSRFGTRLLPAPVLHAVEKAIRRLTRVDHSLPIRVRAVNRQQTVHGIAPLVQQLAQQIIDLAARDLQPQMFRGDVFERVGLVENHDVVFRQDRVLDALRAQCQVAEEQGVIDHEQIRLLHQLAGLEIEATLVICAILAEAVLRIAFDQVPYRADRAETQIAAAAVGRAPAPAAQVVELIERPRLAQQIDTALQGHAQSPLAQIVAPALDEQRQKRLCDDALQKRNVLADELFLQADRVRGNDDAAILVGQRCLDRRNEIGETFADAGARFDHEMPALGNSRRHRVGHFELLRPRFVIAQPLSDGTGSSQDGAVRHLLIVKQTRPVVKTAEGVVGHHDTLLAEQSNPGLLGRVGHEVVVVSIVL